MKYKYFVTGGWALAACVLIGGVGWSVTHPATANTTAASATAVTASAPVPPAQAPTPYQATANAPTTAQSPAPSNALATADVRNRLEAWLSAHPDRQGKMRAENILPDAPFKATAIRFDKLEDAAKFSNNENQWSQIRLDLDRDGRDDEKWLLKNGHTYKRETLDSTGRVVSTQYFK